MSYCNINYKTKKELKEAVLNGIKIYIYNPGLGIAPDHGTAYIEGPHYPEPHKWYATVEMKDGYILKVVE